MFRGLWNTAQKSPSDINKARKRQNGKQEKGESFSGARRAVGRNLEYSNRQVWARTCFDSRQYSENGLFEIDDRRRLESLGGFADSGDHDGYGFRSDGDVGTVEQLSGFAGAALFQHGG